MRTVTATRLWNVLPFLTERIEELRLREPLDVSFKEIKPGREVYVVSRGEVVIGYLPDSWKPRLKAVPRDYRIIATVLEYPASRNFKKHLSVSAGFCEVVIELIRRCPPPKRKPSVLCPRIPDRGEPRLPYAVKPAQLYATLELYKQVRGYPSLPV